MPNHSRLAGVSLVAMAALALVACSSGSGSSTASSNTKSGVTTVNVTAVNENGDDTCKIDATSAKAGPVTFVVQNKSATAVSEVELITDQRIVGEKENLAPGLPAVSFTVTLDGGNYEIYCPGASNQTTPFKVTGKAAIASGSTQTLLQQGATQYASYVTGQIGDMVTATRKLNDAVQAGNIAKAKLAYAAARPFYERAESAVEGFVLPGFKASDNKGNLDYLIDMRASNLDTAVGWHGFHAVERDVFEHNKIDAGTKKYSSELLSNVKKLNTVVKTLTYKPEDLANGAAGLLEEVQSNKITGEEEKYSHIDLVDFAANVEGAQQAFANLKPGLQKINPTLTKQIAAEFTNVDNLLNTYRDPNALGGYKRYTAALKKSDSKQLSEAVQRLQDPLSTIAEKVATAA